MRFNKKLIDKANEIRIKYLNSSDQFDNTIEINPDWTQNKVIIIFFVLYFKSTNTYQYN